MDKKKFKDLKKIDKIITELEILEYVFSKKRTFKLYILHR